MAALAMAGMASAAGVQFPTYNLTTTKFPASMGADIAASAFVDADGRFRLLTSAANYEMSDSGGSFVDTYTADNFGVMANGGQGRQVRADTYWNRPGSYCYKLDERAERPLPSIYQDDHCDVVGVWVDPATRDWVGVVNDEYQFDPLNTNASTPENDRIKTSKHNNRILLAKSSDQGASWQIVDALAVDNYQPNQTITPELFPNSTYSWGLSGVRFYVDYPTGYAYILYNHQIRNKKGDATLIKWYNQARAPLNGGLEPSNWRKLWNGQWTEPARGGRDAFYGEPLGFTVAYDPKTDYLAYEGTSADGKQVAYQSTPLVNGTFTFSDPDGKVYTVDTKPTALHPITTSDGQVLDKIAYHDPALNRDFVIGRNYAGQITVNQTDSYGATSFMVPKTVTTVFKDHTLNRLYVQPTTIFQSAFQYNAQARKYRAIGYDGYIYENDDLANPRGWVPVGVQPADVLPHQMYTSALDTGSLSNQNIGSRTFSILSDLKTTVDTLTMTPPADGQTAFSHDTRPIDSTGQPIDPTQQYSVTIGNTALSNDTWLLEEVKEVLSGDAYTGFYRLRDYATGRYLQLSGSTAADQRKWGAVATLGPAQLGYDPNGNGGHGSPGGSDQWYLLPYGSNTPAVLDESSDKHTIEEAQRTSLKDAAGYKLVNRNSGHVLVSQDGKEGGAYVLAPNEFDKNEEQAVTIQPTDGKRPRSRYSK